MKKYIVVYLLIVSMLVTSVPTLAVSNSAESQHLAQVHYAKGVDEYGSNIFECSEVLRDVPASITQNAGNITIDITLNNQPIVIEGTIKGRNLSDNILYYDAACNSTSFEVISMTYNNNLSPTVALYKDYSYNYSNAQSILKAYIKVQNSDVREYYFVEFFDFVLVGFEEIMRNAVRCEPDFWNMKEFKPIDTEITQSEIMTLADGDVHYYTITDSYYNADILQYAVMELQKADDMTNIPVSGSDFWMHTLTVYDKYTLCPSVPDYALDTSHLCVFAGDFQANAPIGAAYLSTKIDGKTSNPINLWDVLSADISVGYGPLSVSLSLSEIITHKGSVDIDQTFTGYVNDETNDNMTKGIKVEFDDTHPLYDVGEYYQVLSCVRDYGDAQSEYSRIYARWSVEMYNYGNDNAFTYAMIDSYSYRVGV